MIGNVKITPATGEALAEANENAAKRSAGTHVYHPKYGVISCASADQLIRQGARTGGKDSPALTREDFEGHPDAPKDHSLVKWPTGDAPVNPAAESKGGEPIDYDKLADAMLRAQKRAESKSEEKGK